MALADESPASREGQATPSSAPMRFQEAYDRHFAFVWRNLRRLGVADASLDDAAQEVFLVVFRRLSEVAHADERAWLFGVVRRVAADQRRTVRRRAVEPLPEELPDGGALAPDVLAVRRLHELLDRLDPEKREVFVMAELEQMTAQEIAVATGAPINTVYSRLRAARIEFDQHLTRASAKGGGR